MLFRKKDSRKNVPVVVAAVTVALLHISAARGQDTHHKDCSQPADSVKICKAPHTVPGIKRHTKSSGSASAAPAGTTGSIPSEAGDKGAAATGQAAKTPAAEVKTARKKKPPVKPVDAKTLDNFNRAKSLAHQHFDKLALTEYDNTIKRLRKSKKGYNKKFARKVAKNYSKLLRKRGKRSKAKAIEKEFCGK